MIKCDICGDIMTDMSFVRVDIGLCGLIIVKDVCKFKCLPNIRNLLDLPGDWTIKKMSKIELKEEFAEVES